MSGLLLTCTFLQESRIPAAKTEFQPEAARELQGTQRVWEVQRFVGERTPLPDIMLAIRLGRRQLVKLLSYSIRVA